MPYRQLQAVCKQYGLPAQGRAEVLRQNLEDYLLNPLETIRRIRREKNQSTNGWVDWKNHAAREILQEDFEPRGWLYDLEGEEARARVVYDIYQGREEAFRDVPFEQFEPKYTEYRKKATKQRARAAQELEWLQSDRRLYPRQTHNARGEPVFDLDIPAKEHLRADIKNKLHEQLTPMELHKSREEYKKYKLDIFRQRIYQEVRRSKYIHYLDKKRTEKRDAFNGPIITFARGSNRG